MPVEVEVEKSLGFNGKKDIEKYGVDKFIKLCKESVWQYKSMWEDLTDKIAYWVDMEHPYITYENSYIESIFWALKQMNDKGLIYKGHKVVPYCPRCGTSLSKAELENGDNYKLLKENSVYVKFKSNDEEKHIFSCVDHHTLDFASNVALCMNPSEDYVKVESEGKNYIMLEKLLPTCLKRAVIKLFIAKREESLNITNINHFLTM